MRRLNMLLVFGMLATFLIHAIMGGLRLAGADTDAMKTIAWVSVGFMAAHIVVTTVLTLRIIIPLIMHLFIFSASNEGAYRLQAFTLGRMISQILLVATLALHILTNIKPALISLGIKSEKALGADVLLVLAVLLLLFAVAFLIYYLRWMAV